MKKKIIISVLMFLLILMIAGCTDSKTTEINKAEESTEVKNAVGKWEENSVEVEKFKKLYVSGYNEKTIGEGLLGEYNVTEWKFKEDNGKKFLKCNYKYQETELCLVFYLDEYNNVNIAEYYVGDKKQGNQEIKDCCEKIFAGIDKTEEIEKDTEDKETEIFPEDRIGYYTNGYWAIDIKQVDNNNKTILYDGYEFAYSRNDFACMNQTGIIIDSDTLEINGTQIIWENDSFTLANGEDALFMSSGVGSGHDIEHGAGTYVKGEKELSDISEPTNGIVKSIELYEGEYRDYRAFGDAFDCPEMYCTLVVSNVTDTSFEFCIKQWNPLTLTDDIIFLNNTAEFTGDGSTATYYGDQYTLNFTFPDVVTIEVSGFQPTEGVSYMCNGIPGHEFS